MTSFLKKSCVIVFTFFTITQAEANPPQLNPSKLMAVHLTDILPEDGLMIPGNGIGELNLELPKGYEKDYPAAEAKAIKRAKQIKVPQDIWVKEYTYLPQRRFTLHWSLGGPVPAFMTEKNGEIRHHDWSVYSYAILEPLAALADESIGCEPNDWVTFGPHKLSPQAIIIAPNIDKDRHFPAKKIVFYDTDTMNVAQAVQNYLAEANLPQLTYDFATQPRHVLKKENIDVFLDKVEALSPNQQRSVPIRFISDVLHQGNRSAYKQQQLKELEHHKLWTLICEEELTKQLILIDGQKIRLTDYFKAFFKKHPHLRWQIISSLSLTKAEYVLKGFGLGTLRFQLAHLYHYPATDIPQFQENYLSFIKSVCTSNSDKRKSFIKRVKTALQSVKADIPPACQEVAKLWFLKINLWLRDYTKHCISCKESGTAFFMQDNATIQTHINKIKKTIHKNITLPLRALYRPLKTEEALLQNLTERFPQELISQNCEEKLPAKNDLNFLAQKYPKLRAKAAQKFNLLPHEDQRGAIDKNGGEKVLYDKVIEVLSLATHDDAYSRHFSKLDGSTAQKLENTQINLLNKNHPQHGFFKTFFKEKLESHTILEDITLSAEYLYQKVEDDNEDKPLILFLGRTPCLVQVAYEEILNLTGNTHHRVEHVCFSGHPDAETLRTNQLSTQYATENRVRNIVTLEKQNHFFNYLDSKKLYQASKIYIVDSIQSGSGLNSFLNVLSVYQKTRTISELNLHFVMLCNTFNVNQLNTREHRIFSEQPGCLRNNFTLSFRENKAKNIKEINIAGHVTLCSFLPLIAILDEDILQAVGVHGIEYPAQKWTPEFDQERDEGGVYHQSIYKYMQENMNKLIAKHMEKAGLKRAVDE